VYSVTATANGCTSVASNSIAAINPIPAAPIVGSNSPLCEGANLSLTASTISEHPIYGTVLMVLSLFPKSNYCKRQRAAFR
jgi:hypothetical protein